MITKAILFTSIFYFTLALHIQLDEPLGGGLAFSSRDTSEISRALNNDPFFKYMNQVKVLGNGSYGVVMQVEQGGKEYALKLTDQEWLQSLPVVNEQILMKPSDKFTNINNNMRFIKYLNQLNFPFMQQVLTDRTVLIARPASTPSDQDDETDPEAPKEYKIEFKNAWVSEFANLQDMEKLAEKMGGDKQKAIDAATVIFYRLAYTFDQIVDQSIIHGDLKIQNIFMKYCDPLKSASGISDIKNLCPVIGDWDIAYNTKSELVDNLRYTFIGRPPEMIAATYQDSFIFIGSHGYKYTLKEDVFALGVTIANFLFKAGVTSSDSAAFILLKATISHMIKPLTYSDIELLFSVNGNQSQEEYDREWLRQSTKYMKVVDVKVARALGDYNTNGLRIKKYIDALLSEFKSYNFVTGEKLSDSVQRSSGLIKFLRSLRAVREIKYYLEEMLKQTKMINSKMAPDDEKLDEDTYSLEYLINSAINTGELGDACSYGEFEELYSNMMAVDVASRITSERITMKEVLTKATFLVSNLEDKSLRVGRNEAESFWISKAENQNSLSGLDVEKHWAERDILYLGDSFIRADLKTKLKFCTKPATLEPKHNAEGREVVSPSIAGLDLQSFSIKKGTSAEICEYIGLHKRFQENPQKILVQNSSTRPQQARWGANSLANSMSTRMSVDLSNNKVEVKPQFKKEIAAAPPAKKMQMEAPKAKIQGPRPSLGNKVSVNSSTLLKTKKPELNRSMSTLNFRDIMDVKNRYANMPVIEEYQPKPTYQKRKPLLRNVQGAVNIAVKDRRNNGAAPKPVDPNEATHKLETKPLAAAQKLAIDRLVRPKIVARKPAVPINNKLKLNDNKIKAVCII